ncbi:hypothetical protein PUNSTDRAFT_140394 [Punctularia strigosozonata HHB-11173 SS5]|uniref:uncharacterized protein n=1 Tax=Punctularia strigosozonata (strain HHB-11173) TaxID=741275 RepID=UPI0004416B22|nr:uncharacterized protein PUNSTDRAFT_140394 [Punctularia strigosozonata HHB-11173 SS5]EIN13991.1 hypothetical protein PUNSTDRAFT_140394 [Punctularia strigosozonata HHB-11173 SS5]
MPDPTLQRESSPFVAYLSGMVRRISAGCPFLPPPHFSLFRSLSISSGSLMSLPMPIRNNYKNLPSFSLVISTGEYPRSQPIPVPPATIPPKTLQPTHRRGPRSRRPAFDPMMSVDYRSSPPRRPMFNNVVIPEEVFEEDEKEEVAIDDLSVVPNVNGAHDGGDATRTKRAKLTNFAIYSLAAHPKSEKKSSTVPAHTSR